MDGFLGFSAEYWGLVGGVVIFTYVLIDRLDKISRQLCIIIKTLRNEDPNDC